jgi:hypothetical protein
MTEPTFVILRGDPPGDGLGIACFTEDRTIRWWLQRAWDPTARDMVWIMLNPSLADESTDDATIRRCTGYARREGCGSVTVVNLFPVISTDPHLLITRLATGGNGDTRWVPASPWWEDTNLGFIRAAARGARLLPGELSPVVTGLRPRPLVMCGWGRWGGHPGLAWSASSVLYELARDRTGWHALGYTAGGQPAHPLRLRADVPILEARP